MKNHYIGAFLVSLILAVSLILVPPIGPDHANSQGLQPAKWVLIETQINPDNVLSNYTYERRVTLDGRQQDGLGYVTTQISTHSISVSEHIKDLSGRELWLKDYTFNYNPPPSELVPGEKYEIAVDGNLTGIDNCGEYETCGPVNFLSGAYISRTYANSDGSFKQRTNDKFIELGYRTANSVTLTVPLSAPNAKGAISDNYYRIEIRTASKFEIEGGNPDTSRDNAELRVAWIYHATEIEEEPTPAPTVVDVTQTPSPTPSSTPKDSGDEALEILGRIGREVAQDRIQNEIKGYLDDLRDMLAEGLITFGEWVRKMSEYPTDYIEDPLLDDIDIEIPEFPEFTWDEVVEQLSDRVKSPAGVNEESMDELFELVRDLMWAENADTGKFTRMRKTGYDLIDMKLNDGSTVKVGVLVTPEGQILYTSNGKDYSSNLGTAVVPSRWEQVTAFLTDTKDWAWSAAFEGSTRNPDTDLQNKVASEVLEDLRVQLAAGETPKSVGDWVEGKLWDTTVKEPVKSGMHQWLWQKAHDTLKDRITSGGRIPSADELDQLDMFEDLKFQFDSGKTTTPKAWAEYKSQTGLDLFDLTKAGQAAVAGGEFAVESIKTMGRSLQDADFAVRARAYIEERQAGYEIQVIWDRMKNHELPELDIGAGKMVSGGVSSMMASSKIEQEAQLGVMFTMYEQAYQRYLLAKDMGRRP